VNEEMLGATLTCGDVLPDGGWEIVVTTPSGRVAVLTARDGAERWRTTLAAGTVSGAVCGADQDGTRSVYVGDRATAVSVLPAAADARVVTAWGVAGLRSGDALIAGLRPFRVDATQPPSVLVCPTGGFTQRNAGVCLMNPNGVRWRYAIEGAVWGTPAIVDFNRDGAEEILVTFIDAGSGGAAHGGLDVISASGHCLRRERFAAPIESSPIVADVDGDDRLEVLVADQAGLLHCFATESAGEVRWGLAGGDSHNTRNVEWAYAYGQVPHAYQWAWRPER
jgi:outer membrane protein assembly factor BamB